MASKVVSVHLLPTPSTTIMYVCQWLLFLIIFVKCGRADTNPPETLFTAYDCSWPKNIQEVNSATSAACITTKILSERKNVTYRLLQEGSRFPTKGYSCRLEGSRTITYCGTYDHQTVLEPATHYNDPQPVDAASCRQYWQTGIYIGPKENFKLERNTINIIQFQEVGYSDISGGEIICEGEDYLYKHQIIHRAVVTIRLKILLQEEDFEYDPSGISNVASKENLQCPPFANECETKEATYIWTTDNRTCALSIIRDIPGTQNIDSQGREMFQSTNGPDLRFEKGQATSFCGMKVYKTNRARWYLQDIDDGGTPNLRTLSPELISIPDLIQSHNDYMIDQYRETIEQLQRDLCQTQMDLLFHQRVERGNPGITGPFDNGTFRVIKGERIWQYQCRPTLVRTRDVDVCYGIMPVGLLEIPSRPYHLPTDLGLGTLLNHGQLLFLEPLTRILTHNGTIIPCSQMASIRYQDTRGEWLSIPSRASRRSSSEFYSQK